jgi:hypothetical protein
MKKSWKKTCQFTTSKHQSFLKHPKKECHIDSKSTLFYVILMSNSLAFAMPKQGHAPLK